MIQQIFYLRKQFKCMSNIIIWQFDYIFHFHLFFINVKYTLVHMKFIYLFFVLFFDSIELIDLIDLVNWFKNGKSAFLSGLLTWLILPFVCQKRFFSILFTFYL